MAATIEGATAAPGAGPIDHGLRLVLLTLSLALAGVVIGYVATTRRTRGPELEPPPESRAGATTHGVVA